MTFKVIVAIHYEAFKLWLKKVKLVIGGKNRQQSTFCALKYLIGQKGITKVLIQYSIPFESSYFPPDRVTVVEDFFYLVHIGNKGAAWGMFSEYSGILTLLSFAVLLFQYHRILDL